MCVRSLLFESIERVQNKRKIRSEIAKKSIMPLLVREKLLQTLLLFKDAKYYQEFYQNNLELTQGRLEKCGQVDNLINAGYR